MTVGFALIVAIICGACVFLIVRDYQEYEKARLELLQQRHATTEKLLSLLQIEDQESQMDGKEE